MNIIEFDLNAIQQSWKECQELYHSQGKSIVPPTYAAHVLFLSDEFWAMNSKKVERIVMKFKTQYDVLPIESLTGKVRNKVSSFKLPKVSFNSDVTSAIGLYQRLDNFDKALFSYTMAALLVELMIDNKLVELDVKTTPFVDSTGTRRFKSITNVTLGGKEEPVNILRGYEEESGVVRNSHIGFERVPKALKDMDAQMASIPFKVSDVYTRERMAHFYKGSVAYNAPTTNEKSVARHFRFNSEYLEQCEALASKDKFYMPMNHCSRIRSYYDAVGLPGMKPQGKLFEVAMLDAAEARVYEKSAIGVCKHIICDIRYGKMTQKAAVNRFSTADLLWALEQEPLNVPLPTVAYSEETKGDYRAFEDACGEAIICLKAALCIEMVSRGEPCNYLFGKDLTNSGLIMLANSSRSEKMLTGANMMGQDCVNDSHSQFGEAQQVMHLGRKAVKEIHTPLLHGSSTRTIVDILHKHVSNSDDFTVESVDQHNIDAYGEEVKNIDLIAQWGADVVTNNQNILKWKTPDGITACHEAKVEHAEFTVYAASTRSNKSPYKAHKLMSTMPLKLDAKGYPVFSKNTGAVVKTRGLFANITHSLDGTLLRRVIMSQLEASDALIVKHDDYILRPDQFDVVTQICQEFFSELQTVNYYQDALNQIAGKLRSYHPAPQLLVGDAPNLTGESVNFLMP
jgi:hypothetical protein